MIALRLGRSDDEAPLVEEDKPMVKATHDGIYTLNGGRFRMRKGKPLPDGALVEERAMPAAPENKAMPAAPEVKSEAPKPARSQAKKD